MNRVHIVYTSGKVGSTTMVDTLKAAFADEPVFTVRRLTPEGIAEHRAFRPIVSDDVEAAALLDESPVSVSLVTLTREPVAAAVSSFFYNLAFTHPDLDPDELRVQDVVDQIVFGTGSSTPTFHVDWFDREYTPMTGVSPYDTGFDHDLAYQLLTSGRYQSLILRVEDLDSVGPRALQAFYDTDTPMRIAARANTGSAASYAAAYRRFLDVARLSADWVSELYSSKYAQHFYRDDELASFAERWTGRSVAGSRRA